MPKTITRVYQLPADDAVRTQFVEGLKALEEACGLEMLSGSANDEMAYVEKLEVELVEHIGETALEGIRQEFEREAREA